MLNASPTRLAAYLSRGRYAALCCRDLLIRWNRREGRCYSGCIVATGYIHHIKCCYFHFLYSCAKAVFPTKYPLICTPYLEGVSCVEFCDIDISRKPNLDHGERRGVCTPDIGPSSI